MPQPPKVAIFGAEPVVGRVIEQLVAGAGYRPSHLQPPTAVYSDDFAESLSGVHAILLRPSLEAAHRKLLFQALEGVSGGEKIPLLEMPWPLGVEELRRTIESALSAGTASAVTTAEPTLEDVDEPAGLDKSDVHHKHHEGAR